MPNRHNDMSRSGGRVIGAAGALAGWVWAKAMQRPVDSLAILTAGAMTVLIIVNALFLQSGSRAAPFFAIPASATIGAAHVKGPEQLASTPAPQLFPAQSGDAIAELIGPSPRIVAVQRVLSEFGYGQIKPSGMLDDATSAAIQRFERDHKMPITGHVSERLVSELAAMTGQAVQ